MKPPIIFLMGPTASGKTDLATALCSRLPVDLISVDSALVYRGMDVGTAKPNAEELSIAPHRLIDIRDPADSYSVADFCVDAEKEIAAIHSAGRIPLLVGGTMMYFKTLLQGLADMPSANEALRSEIEAEAAQYGWPCLHQQLALIDPEYAIQIHPNHSRRIARALEVYRASGLTVSQLHHKQKTEQSLIQRFRVIQLALFPKDRAQLHLRIGQRFSSMLEHGLIDEVEGLRSRSDLTLTSPSMRSVGYRQVWQYLDGVDGFAEPMSLQQLNEKGAAATRQLAKRQLTWLKSWQGTEKFSPDWGNSGKNIDFVLNFLPTKSI